MTKNPADPLAVKLNVKQHFQTYLQNTGQKLLCFVAYSDVFYVTEKHSQVYTYLADYFEWRKLFLEVSVLTIFYMLTPSKEFLNLYGMYYAHLFRYRSGETF